MTVLLPEGEETATAPAISRRRVLQGVAWATPAVVVATAVPSAAASVELGAIAFSGTSAYMNSTTLTVTGRFVFVGSSSALPVTNVVATIVVPTARVTTAAPTPTGAGWTYTGRTTSGSNTLYTFSWASADLTSVNNATTLLSVAIPKTSDVSALTVVAHGDGRSNGVDLPQITASAAVTIAGTLVWNTVYSAGKSGGNFYFGFQNRHSGPYSPVQGGPITNIAITVTWPKNDASIATAAGATGWTITDLGTSGNDGRARFTYSGTLNVNDTTTQPQPGFPAKPSKSSTTFTLTGTYTSAGSTFTLPTQTVTVS
jgi:hypothetical protein